MVRPSLRPERLGPQSSIWVALGPWGVWMACLGLQIAIHNGPWLLSPGDQTQQGSRMGGQVRPWGRVEVRLECTAAASSCGLPMSRWHSPTLADCWYV